MYFFNFMKIKVLCSIIGLFSLPCYSQLLFGQFVSMSLASANPELGYVDGLGAPLHGTGGNSCLVVNSGFVFGPSEQWDNTSAFVYRCQPESSNDESSSEWAWRIYPNPSQGEYFLEASDVSLWEVYDNQGRLVKSSTVIEPDGPQRINISDMSAGYYILQFEQRSEFGSRKQQTQLIMVEKPEPSLYD